MKEYPILFQPDMIRAKMDGRKSQTRRTTKLDAVNKSPDDWKYLGSLVNSDGELINQFLNKNTEQVVHLKCPYGAPGSILWTRETWRKYAILDENGYFGPDVIDFAADNPEPMVEHDGDGFRMYDRKGREKMIPFRPSIHMKKEHARIYSINTGVRIQRLQDISEEDVISEGIACLSKDASFMEKTGRTPTWKYGIPDNDGLPGGIGWAWENWKMSPKEAFRALIKKINGTDIWKLNPWVRAISFRVLSTTGRPANLEELCAAR